MKNNIVRHALSLLLLVLCISSASAQGSADAYRDSIFAKALEKCPNPHLKRRNVYDYYMSKQTVKNPIVNGLIMRGEYWLVFVDQNPEANWEHECKYIYVSAERKSGEYEAYSFDSKFPPKSVSLEARKLTPRTQERIKKMNGLIFLGGKESSNPTIQLKGKPQKVQTRFSPHTYALILSGGSAPELNAKRYWNDCSYVYTTLTQTYGVPKQNIRVLMADGRSPEKDMNVGLSTLPNLYNSSPDLDGDGRPEIDYSATKDALAMVVSEFKSKLTDEDHLLVFVTDHGGKDDNNGKAYINMWKSQRVYSDEFAGYFKDFNVGYISFVLGQCYSGGFIPALKADNHIIMTACKENEKSFCRKMPDCDYDEFLYNWTSALNRFDTYGNAIPEVTDTLPGRKLSPVTFKRAFDYAVEKDAYNKGQTILSVENPQISILGGSTAEDLALDSIPPTVYLYITKDNTSVNETTSNAYGQLVESMKNLIRYKFWTNRDIWLRNQDDGMVNLEHESPHVTEDDPTVYVYTMIKNRGVKAYSDKSVRLVTRWAKSSLVLSRESWYGTLTGDVIGGEVYRDYIRKTIAPCDSVIIRQPFTFTGEALDNAMEDGFKICLLSALTDRKESASLPGNDLGVVPVWNSDRFAQRNQYRMLTKLQMEFIRTFPTAQKEMNLSLIVHNDADPSACGENALDVKLKVPDSMVGQVSMKGCTASRIDPHMITIADRCSAIQNFTLYPEDLDSIGISATVRGDCDITVPLKRSVNVAVFDEGSGEIIGGEQFDFIVNPRPKIDPQIDKILESGGKVKLTAKNVSEDAVYEWYDKDGNLVGKGKELTLGPTAASGEYTLRVVAVKDNVANSATVNVEQRPLIKDIEVTNPGKVKVNFNYPVPENVSARVSSPTGNTSVEEYMIDSGATQATFHITNQMSDIMQMSIAENGKVIETRKIIMK